jgi:hypothetical protein
MKTEYYKSTAEIRAEVSNDYVYVRNLGDKGGVIDASLTDRTAKKVIDCLQSVTTENFSQVWDLLKAIKGLRLEYKRN